MQGKKQAKKVTWAVPSKTDVYTLALFISMVSSPNHSPTFSFLSSETCLTSIHIVRWSNAWRPTHLKNTGLIRIKFHQGVAVAKHIGTGHNKFDQKKYFNDGAAPHPPWRKPTSKPARLHIHIYMYTLFPEVPVPATQNQTLDSIGSLATSAKQHCQCDFLFSNPMRTQW